MSANKKLPENSESISIPLITNLLIFILAEEEFVLRG